MARFTGPTGGGSGVPGPQGPAGADGADALWNFVGEYNSGADYNVGDVVTYNGGTYYRILPANAGYAPGTEYWTTVAEPGLNGTDGQGIAWRGVWGPHTYALNDLVIWETDGKASVYIRTVASMENNYQPDTLNGWALVVSDGDNGVGFTWRDQWSPELTYAINDVVFNQGSSYIAYSSPFGIGYGEPGSSEGFGWLLMTAKGTDGQGFTWRGEWNSNPSPTPYAINDVVEYQGSSYVRVDTVSANSQPPFFGPESPTPGPNSDWEVIAAAGESGEGFTWRGEYDSMATYQPQNDIVSYQGALYISNQNPAITGMDPYPFIGNTPGNGHPWDLFIPAAEGFNWRGEYNSMTTYAAFNDIVSYQGGLYISSNEGGGLPFSFSGQAPIDSMTGNVSSYWEVFIPKPESFVWRGEYNSMTAYSAINDIVSYQGGLYISDNLVGPAETPMDFMGVSPIDMMGNVSSAWEVFVPKAQSFVWKGTWSSMPMTPYVANDVVFHNGSSYLATPDFMGAPAGSGTPGGSYTGWKLMASGLSWRGAYEQMPNPSYKLADIVSYNGSSYIAISDMVMGTPGDQSGSSSWALMAAAGETGEGFIWRGDWNGSIDPAYSNNDLVIYNGSTYLVTDSTLLSSTTPPDNNDGQGATQGWALFTAKGDPASIDTGTTTINTYSPVWSGTGLDINPTAPVPPATGSYIKIGNLVQVQIEVNFTEVLDFGTGQYSITLPFPSLYHTDVYGGSVHDAGSTVTHYSLKGHLSDNSDVATLWYISGSSQDAPFDNNAPANLTTADKFHMAFSYIAALP